MLVDAMLDQGAVLQNLRAKLFGGASMMRDARPRATHIGLQNLRVATEVLGRAGIPVLSSDVGGAHGRKIVFNTDDGCVSRWEL
jgi:chemotaxis protein CheD